MNLSLNEVLYYFTRAAVGAGAPFGLAEDFGRAAFWLGRNGKDPSRICAPVLLSLEKGDSTLMPKLNQMDVETVLQPPHQKNLSAILAGSFAGDWITSLDQNSIHNPLLTMERVDSPFMVAAALGANGSEGCVISWEGGKKKRFRVYHQSNESWTACWSDSVLPEQSGPGSLKITPLSTMELDYGNWTHHRNRNYDEGLDVFKNGVSVHESWLTIHTYFKRCLIPSTVESRMTGAGAGLVDLD